MPQYTARGIIPVSGGSGFPAVFQGNPNATSSSITGSIVLDATSGQLPAVVQASASGITVTGSTIGGILSFMDAEYSWDFGDPSGVETFTSYKRSPSGVTVNANNTQTGPEARYVCRSAGTYTFTLRVRVLNGSGGYTTYITTANFVASAFNKSGGEWWYDSNATGANNGTSPTDAFTSISTLSGKLVNNTAIHIAKGSNFSGTTNIDVGAVSGIRIDTYGSGAKPIINISSGAVTPLKINNSCSDIVISGIVFSRTGGTLPDDGNVLQSASSSAQTAIYLDNCDFTTTVAGGKVCVFMQYDPTVANAANSSRGGFWNCTVTNSQSNAVPLGVYNMPYQWGFFYGGSVSGLGTSTTFDHHIYPNTRLHSCYRYINFGLGPSRNFCINGNYDPIGEVTTPEVAQYHLIAECNLTGTIHGYDASNGPEAPAESIFKNFIIQQCCINGLSFGITGAKCLETGTERDNYVWNIMTDPAGTTGFEFKPSSGASMNRVYRNNIYKPTGGGSGFDSGILSYSGASSNPSQFTDNNIQDQRSTADIFEAWNGATASTLSSNGSLLARNNYFAPNDTTCFLTTDTPETFVAFAVWQTAVNGEASSTFTNGANPAWPDAANGNFG